MFENTDDALIYKVETTLRARDDLALLSDFYYDNAGEEAAIRFESAAETIIESLSTWPYAHAMWEDDKTIRKVNLPKHKVSIIYRIDEGRLEIIAVAAFHTLADPIKARALVDERLALAKEQFGGDA